MPDLKGMTIWMTGLSGAGKTTMARYLYEELTTQNLPCYIADGDSLRSGINANLGFSQEDRMESMRRSGEVAILFAKEGFIVLAPIISPYREAREMIRRRHEEEGLAFVEVYVSTSLKDCESRDPKGLYKLARTGELGHFTGVSDVYEEPISPEIRIDTSSKTSPESAGEVIDFLRLKHLIPRR